MIDENFKRHVIGGTDLRKLMEEYGVKFNSRKAALCISHVEKKPSMTINPRYPKAYCWSCGFSCDAVDFLMLKNPGMGFMDAFRKLAEWRGIEIPEDGKFKQFTKKKDAFGDFSKKIMNSAKIMPKAKVKMNGGQVLANVGVGYLPNEIKDKRWINFLKKQPSEYLEVAGITQEGDHYSGGGAYIWELTRNYKTVGFVRFDKGGNTNVSAKTLDNAPGFAMGEGRVVPWNTFKFLNVTNNVVDALKIHDKAKAWGPGAYYPYHLFKKNTPMDIQVANHFFKNKCVRYISYDKLDVMQFISHVLPVVEDDFLVKLVNPQKDEPVNRDKMKFSTTMSSFIGKFIRENPENKEKFINRLKEIIDRNNTSVFYKTLLKEKLEGLRNEKIKEVSAENEDIPMSVSLEEDESHLPSEADILEAEMNAAEKESNSAPGKKKIKR